MVSAANGRRGGNSAENALRALNLAAARLTRESACSSRRQNLQAKISVSAGSGWLLRAGGRLPKAYLRDSLSRRFAPIF